MANMSYCRFENTYRDLADCLDVLEWQGLTKIYNDASEREKQFIIKLVELSKDVAEFNEDLEDLKRSKHEKQNRKYSTRSKIKSVCEMVTARR